MEILEKVPLAPLTTFAIGGDARYFVTVNDAKDLGAALDYAETRRLPFFILAGGSNILVADEGFDGLVINVGFAKQNIDMQAGRVSVEAGCALADVVRTTANSGLSGMEALYGIPGTVGGAVRGNAGAFGTEIKDILKEVTALNVETREVRTFSNAECTFVYRTSFFKQHTNWIVLAATFTLSQDTDGTAMQRMEKILDLRNERQIQDIRSAGSFFMNPVVHEKIRATFEKEKRIAARENRVPAGWLIEKAGFAGVCEDGVCTGQRSSNYIINSGTATAAAVTSLAQKISSRVESDFGVALHPEITLIGF